MRRVACNYDLLPDRRLWVRVKSADEILAGKLVAFSTSVATRNHPRHRDIWDMFWLKRTGSTVRGDLVRAKIGEQAADPAWLEQALDKCPAIARSASFAGTMRRFLPKSQLRRCLGNPEFMNAMVRDTGRLLRTALHGLTAGERRPEPERGGDLPYADPLAIPDPFEPSSPFDY